jgi:hypothetical protein
MTRATRVTRIAIAVACSGLVNGSCGSKPVSTATDGGSRDARSRDGAIAPDVGRERDARQEPDARGGADGGGKGDTGSVHDGGPPPTDGGISAAISCSALQTLPVRTPTYYVDFSAGSDTADGTTQASAWKHAPGDTNATGTAGAAMLVPGDVVLLKGGVMYEGTIMITASGTMAKPIVLEGGAQQGWGTGTAIIDGQETRALGIGVTGASYVIIEGFEVQSFDKTQSSTGISVTGGSNDEVIGNTLHDIYYATNPNPGSTAWEQQSGNGITVENSPGTNVYANSVRDVGNAGISISADGGTSVTGGITACNEVTNMNWGIVLALGDSVAGTHLGGLVIAHNYIHDFDNYVACSAWHRDGIFAFARPDNGALSIDNVELADNYFEDTLSTDFGSTAWIYIEFVCTNFNVHHNILNASRAYFGVRVLGDGFQVAGNHIFANNVIANSNGQGSTGMHVMQSSGITIENNIFYDDDVGYMIAVDSMTGYSGDYNVFYNTNMSDMNAAFLNAGPAASPGSGAGVEELSLAGLQAKGLEKHSYYADPLWSVPFASISTNPIGFKPQAGSVAVGHGVAVPYAVDYGGTPYPAGKPPDIGAYEQ